MIAICFLVICLCAKGGLSQGFGDSCNQDGVPGVCVNLGSCPSVLANPGKRWTVKFDWVYFQVPTWKYTHQWDHPMEPYQDLMMESQGNRENSSKIRCGFSGREPIICCTDREVGGNDNRFVATPAAARTSTTTEYIPPIEDYKEVIPGAFDDGKCAPVPQKDTAEKTGRKAFDKCIEYQEQLVYPCERGVEYTGKLSRGNYCQHNADELIVGGKDAKRDEFPHMALLGFGEGAAGSLLCGGTVISEHFILTAGHCTYAPKIGPVTSAKVGLLRLSENVPAERVHRIRRVIKHPQYKPPSKYHDIALLETETPIILDQSTIPACLDIGEPIDASRASATGWGHNRSLGLNQDVLQKVTLQKFSTQECTAKFRGVRHLDHGYDDRTQICYGDHEEKKDTCQGDSGGPLQTNNERIHCMYTIIGVTSFGKYCGQVGRPGMYTRVSSYSKWIESVVWP